MKKTKRGIFRRETGLTQVFHNGLPMLTDWWRDRFRESWYLYWAPLRFLWSIFRK